MNRVAIFGGSFDPVHLGHIELSRQARESAGIDRVIFMPCWQSPFKGKTIASGEQRYEMLCLAIEEQGIGRWSEVSDYEITRPEPSYSWQTTEYLQGLVNNADTQWYWILGTDQWDKIEKWSNPERLSEQLHFIVMTRDGQKVTKKQGWQHTAVAFSHPASSTKIRNEYADHQDWLSASVRDYCEQLSIYT